MAKPRSSQAMRNLKSAGWKAANYSARATDKAAVGLIRWAATDHSGVKFYMPSGLGFFGTIRHILMQFLLIVLGAVITGVLAFVLIAYGIPALILGHF